MRARLAHRQRSDRHGLVAASRVACFTCALSCAGPGVAVAAQEVLAAPTVLVDHSTEAIPTFLSWETLPKTLSLDAFSPMEIRALKEELYGLAYDKDRRTGAVRCLGWLYQRSGREMRLIGMQVHGMRGFGITKLNGKFRSASVLGGLFTPRFGEVANLRAAEQVSRDMSNWSGWFLVAGGVKRVSSHDGLCTFLSARCRRYELEGAEYAWIDRKDKSSSPKRFQIADRRSAGAQFIVEDMCPATGEGMMEDAKIGRLGEFGDDLSAFVSGIFFNRPLKDALAKDLKK
jgi:hypothetical protein